MAIVNLGYRDNPLLKKIGIQYDYTQNEIEEYIKCSKEPLHFISNYIKIVNVDEGLVPFDMWDFQKNMVTAMHNNRFVIMKCPRQVGKCFYMNTPIKLRNKSTGDIIETTIGEFYRQRNETNILSEE